MTARSQIHARRAIERCEQLATLGGPPTWWRVWKLRRWLRAYRAIMALDISEAAEAMRDLYPAGDVVAAAAARPHPALGLIPRIQKNGEYLGRKWVEPVEIIERVQIGSDGKPDEDTRSIEVRP